MKRKLNFDYIEEKLSILVTRLELRGGLNILDLQLHSENFYKDLFNLMFGLELININAVQQNSPGIDLIDHKNKTVIQVSSTASKQKIESALSKDLSKYTDYSFKFIFISKDASDLRGKKYKNPHELKFSSEEDIYDVKFILRYVLDKDTHFLENVCAFLKKELKSEPDPEKTESNLTTVVKILSEYDWSNEQDPIEINPYEIENKLEYNDLVKAKDIVNDFKIYSARLDQIYSEFDKQGRNKSQSVLHGIRMEYSQSDVSLDSDDIFFKVIERVTDKIRDSSNYDKIPVEELDFCVGILVVDAFIRCKIFKNPAGDDNAYPRQHTS